MMNDQKYLCPNCKNLVDYGTKFCPHCGTAFSGWGAPPASAAASSHFNNQQAAKIEEGFADKFFSTKGRLNRKRYWQRSLLLSFVSVASGILFLKDLISDGNLLALPALFIVGIIITYASITLGIRRCHDLNKSGFYILLGVLILPGLKVLFQKGTDGANQYGPDPLEN